MGQLIGQIGGKRVNIPLVNNLRNIQMKRLPRNLVADQKNMLTQKLLLIAEKAVSNREFLLSDNLEAMYSKSLELINDRRIIGKAPDALLFFREINGSFEREKTTLSDINLQDLALTSENSPVSFAYNRNLIAYFPDLSKADFIVCNPKKLFSSKSDSSFSSVSLNESEIKLTPGIKKSFKSLLILPIYSEKSKKMHGFVVMGWKDAKPLDAFIDLETMATVFDHMAFVFPFVARRR